VDNFGDIGVCWRLARQLAGAHGLQVRLWVDDLGAFWRICPEIDPSCEVQRCGGVEVRRLGASANSIEPAEVVIEAFACALPDGYLESMARCAQKPRWINLEYLSAEEWVVGCHRLASPSPRLPLTKHFFFPGFSAGTGGLPLERGLDEARQAFQRDAQAQAAFWRSLGLSPPQHDELRFSLFCYSTADACSLFERWRDHSAPITCVVPEGVAVEAVAAFFAGAPMATGRSVSQGQLTLSIQPFLPQDRYDCLLWACDGNFVRGEDSFVRAQWAQRPLVWQPYPQADGAHRAKLEAFLRCYGGGLSSPAFAALECLWTGWSRGNNVGAAWPSFWACREELVAHAEHWAARLRESGDLASNLVRFCSDPV